MDLNRSENTAGELLDVIRILIPNSPNVVIPSLKFEKLSIYNIYTVTDLINALPGNSSVNTVQHATIEEAVSFRVRGDVTQQWAVIT
jgi:hypothetical protein